MRRPLRRSLLVICWLLLLPNLVISLGLKGEGFFSGCFAAPTFSHSRGLGHLNDVIVFATAAPDTLQLYSISQARVINTLKTADRLLDMGVSPIDPAGRPFPRAYVSTKAARVAAYDLLRNTILSEVKLSNDPDASGGALAVSGDGKYVAVGIGNETFQVREIAVLNADNLRERLATISINGDLQDLVANPNPDLHELYIINDRAAKVRIFDFDTLTQQDRILDLTGSPSDFKVSPDGRLALASINARNKVILIDLVGKRLFSEITLPHASPHRIAFTADGTTAYVTDRRVANSLLYRIDLMPFREALARNDFSGIDQEEVVSAKRLPALLTNAAFVPEGAAVSADGKFLYLTGSNQTRFAVVNLEDIETLMAEFSPKYDFFRTMAAQQIPLQPLGTVHDGMFELQGLNLAKDPVTFGVLYDSNIVFAFTSEVGKKDGQPPAVNPTDG